MTPVEQLAKLLEESGAEVVFRHADVRSAFDALRAELQQTKAELQNRNDTIAWLKEEWVTERDGMKADLHACQIGIEQRNDELKRTQESVVRLQDSARIRVVAEAEECVRRNAEIELLLAKIDRMRKALELIYDKYEDGDNCFENPEELEGYIGNAIRLSKEEEDEILALIPKSRALNPHPTEKGAAVLDTLLEPNAARAALENLQCEPTCASLQWNGNWENACDCRKSRDLNLQPAESQPDGGDRKMTINQDGLVSHKNLLQWYDQHPRDVVYMSGRLGGDGWRTMNADGTWALHSSLAAAITAAMTHVVPDNPDIDMMQGLRDALAKADEGEEPRDCPFCGGQADACDTETIGEGSPVYVFCALCGARGALSNNESEAIAKWNHRAK